MGQIHLPRFEDIRWKHQITLPDGRVTPGHWCPLFKEFGLTELDFRGKRVLDIGCLDGQYTFYAESRGASEVISIDINEEQFGKQRFPSQDWSCGYLYAHRQLKSRAKYVFPYSVYDLDPSVFGKFDIVLFLGVIYHLVHPALALERINGVLVRGGTMVLEAEASVMNTMFCHKPKYTSRDFRVIETPSLLSRPLWKLPWRLFRLIFLNPSEGLWQGSRSSKVECTG